MLFQHIYHTFSIYYMQKKHFNLITIKNILMWGLHAYLPTTVIPNNVEESTGRSNTQGDSHPPGTVITKFPAPLTGHGSLSG